MTIIERLFILVALVEVYFWMYPEYVVGCVITGVLASYQCYKILCERRDSYDQ